MNMLKIGSKNINSHSKYKVSMLMNKNQYIKQSEGKNINSHILTPQILLLALLTFIFSSKNGSPVNSNF